MFKLVMPEEPTHTCIHLLDSGSTKFILFPLCGGPPTAIQFSSTIHPPDAFSILLLPTNVVVPRLYTSHSPSQKSNSRACAFFKHGKAFSTASIESDLEVDCAEESIAQTT